MIHTFIYVIIVFLIMFDAYSDFWWKWFSWSLILVYIYMTQAQDWTLKTSMNLRDSSIYARNLTNMFVIIIMVFKASPRRPGARAILGVLDA